MFASTQLIALPAIMVVICIDPPNVYVCVCVCVCVCLCVCVCMYICLCLVFSFAVSLNTPVYWWQDLLEP